MKLLGLPGRQTVCLGVGRATLGINFAGQFPAPYCQGRLPLAGSQVTRNWLDNRKNAFWKTKGPTSDNLCYVRFRPLISAVLAKFCPCTLQAACKAPLTIWRRPEGRGFVPSGTRHFGMANLQGAWAGLFSSPCDAGEAGHWAGQYACLGTG